VFDPESVVKLFVYQWGETCFLAVDIFAMSDAENQDDQSVVFDFADKAVIADPVFPELPQPGAVQRFPDAARIVQLRYPFVKELQDALGVLRVEFG
jgi:hypothetical protein